MSNEFQQILNYLNKTHGVDFCTNRYSSLERKINNRMKLLRINTSKAYIQCLEKNPKEIATLVDLLTVNVSRFFRNSLTFEYLAQKTLPAIISNKKKTNDNTLRIWSAGCANGEEPYSIAILLNEILQKEKVEFKPTIFATDISRNSLQKAKQGVFLSDKLENVKYGLLQKYFTLKDNHFILNAKVRNMVTFSFYDITDSKTSVPPESVFGDFDLVLCRNVLIYFQLERQHIIFNKLFHSLTPSGYLVLGEAERLPSKLNKYFFNECDYSYIYRKADT